MRQPITRTEVYYIVRFWRAKDDHVLFIEDVSRYGERNRCWSYSEKVEKAYHFRNRADAKRAIKSKKFEDFLKGPRTDAWAEERRRIGDRYKHLAYYWEIIKVTETITTNFEEEITGSNAPAMIQLARAAS